VGLVRESLAGALRELEHVRRERDDILRDARMVEDCLREEVTALRAQASRLEVLVSPYHACLDVWICSSDLIPQVRA
jgi:hypothetical protein